MKLNIDQWDKKISPYLGAIQTRAWRIGADCQQILEWVGQLVAVPSFETQALDQIEKQIIHLEEITKKIKESLDTLQAAIDEYNAKEKLK